MSQNTKTNISSGLQQFYRENEHRGKLKYMTQEDKIRDAWRLEQMDVYVKENHMVVFITLLRHRDHGVVMEKENTWDHLKQENLHKQP